MLFEQGKDWFLAVGHGDFLRFVGIQFFKTVKVLFGVLEFSKLLPNTGSPFIETSVVGLTPNPFAYIF
jgi:hypothetical protein